MKFPVAIIAVVIVALGGAYQAFRYWRTAADPTAAAATSSEGSEEEPRLTVELTPEKLAATEIRTVEVAEQTLQATQEVPGRIDYNASRTLELKAPFACIAKKVLVQPGDQVDAGTTLVVLDGPEIGLARAEVHKQEAELALRKRDREQAEQVSANLEDLCKELAARVSPEQVDKDFEGKLLGENRQKILALYAKHTQAEIVAANQKIAAGRNAVSERTLQQARTAREETSAEFNGAVELARFESRQHVMKTIQDEEFARRTLRVSELKLAAMAGNFAHSAKPADENAMNELEVRAPFAGTIEQRPVVETQRVAQGETVLILADKQALKVSAEIRENQWAALQIRKGQELKVKALAFPDREFVAEVQYAGGSVSAHSRAVPLVASIDNSAGLLKPGMFVWVKIPSGEPVKSLAVPPGAVMREGGESFVFIEESQLTYRRADVKTGLATDDWIAISSGLEPGQKIVSKGAFILKSELLLEQEVE